AGDLSIDPTASNPRGWALTDYRVWHVVPETAQVRNRIGQPGPLSTFYHDFLRRECPLLPRSDISRGLNCAVLLATMPCAEPREGTETAPSRKRGERLAEALPQ